MARKPPRLDTIGKQNAYAEYLRKTPNAPELQGDEEEKPQGLATDTVTGRAPIGAPSPFILKALDKAPKDRTPQEVEAIKQRRKIEEITAKNGGKVKQGISKRVAAEENAGEEGAIAAAEGLAAKDARDSVLAKRGYNPDGTKMADVPEAKPAAKTSGGTITMKDGKKVVVPASDGASAPAPSGAPIERTLPEGARPALQGFATRTLADGSVRGISGGQMQEFSTREAAMNYYRPPAPVAPAPAMAPQAAPAQPAPATMAQPVQPAAAPVPAAPVRSGTMKRTPSPEAARTTSPTATLNQSMAKPDGIATNTAAPAPDFSTVPASELFAQATGARPSPGAPTVPLGAAVGEMVGRVKNKIDGAVDSSASNSIANNPVSRGLGLNKPGAVFNPFAKKDDEVLDLPASIRAGNTERPMGTPMRSGYQADAEKLKNDQLTR